MERREVVASTKAASELRSTIRVYRKEFLFDSRYFHEGEATAAFDATYGGRIAPEDVEVRMDPVRFESCELWIRRWNLSGEYKDPAVADSKAEEQRVKGYEVKVVPRNSREEHRLRSYGVVKLA